MHALFDYHEGKKSFNQTSALMVRVKTHTNGLPAIQTGGNVGTAAWFVAWRILKCEKVCLVGINHSWDLNDPWENKQKEDVNFALAKFSPFLWVFYINGSCHRYNC